MRLSILFASFGAASFVSAAAINQARPADLDSDVFPSCGPVATVTTTITVKDAPPTVTIAVEDTSAIASSFSRIASIDTLQVSYESALAPVSAPYPTSNTFIHTILVPGFEATEAPNNGTSVYYVSVGHNTTDWNYTPTSSLSVPIGLTTITVLPVPWTPLPSNRTTTTRRTTVVSTATVRPSFTSPSSGWNHTNTNSSVVGGVGTAGTGTGVLITTAVTTFVTTVTQSVTVNMTTPFPTAPPCLHNTTAYGLPGYESQAYNATGYGAPATSPSSADLDRRQTCTLISASMNGEWVSWCNNWDGTGTLTYTSWETTTTLNYGQEATDISSSGLAPTTTAETSATSGGLSSTTSSTSASASTACGQVGAFKIGFDNLPAPSATDNSTVNWPPIFNPFEHFWWSDGWSYMPPPTGPFPPESGSYLAEFRVSEAGNNTGSPNAGQLPMGSFGAGVRRSDDRYWFEANSAWVGCDNNATDLNVTCDFVATGYQWDGDRQQEQVVVTQHFTQPPCPNFKNCRLQQVFFNSEFTRLTTMSFYANVKGEIKNFYLDSLDLAWFNNTCAAGLTRISSHKV